MPKPGMRKNSNSGAASQTVQVHLRLPAADADLLKQFANERNQTLSGFVRSLLRSFRNAQRAKSG